MTSISPNTIVGRPISRGKAPKVPSELYIPMDFSTTQTYSLSANVQEGIRNVVGIEGIQSVYIDNSLNATTLTLTMNDTGQNIVCPAYSQAIFPVFFLGFVLTFTATCVGGQFASVMFLNTREQAQIWAARSTAAGTITVSGTVFTVPDGVSATSRNVSLSSNATTKQIMAANASRKRFILFNPSDAAGQGIALAEKLFWSEFNTLGYDNGSGYELSIGGSYDSGAGPCFTGALYFNAATAPHNLVAVEYS